MSKRMAGEEPLRPSVFITREQLFRHLAADFAVRILVRVDVHIGIAAFEFANQIGNRSSRERAYEILAGQNAFDHAASYGNAELVRSEQIHDDGPVHPWPPQVDMRLRDAGNIAHDEREPQLRAAVVQLE